ncbi:fluoride efflux transporter CrcB [Nocardioides euryhalodurans]|uniref:fluoride efflux transporter CrcB n=1 Tax=Nocardioides euryhalodurans TaxID=2518370 RepID=UPI001ABE9549|nr:fluoride efflux transporter CrcB [Nocardioides euryhalodurans]
MSHHAPPVDPDARAPGSGPRVLAAVALGGGLGSAARWSVSELLVADGFPWATFAVNVAGCLLLGVLMVVVTDVVTDRPLLRPFVGVGVLGGFTTFSTYAVETRDLLAAGEAAVASAYVLGSVAAGLVAVWAGLLLTRRALDAGARS